MTTIDSRDLGGQAADGHRTRSRRPIGRLHRLFRRNRAIVAVAIVAAVTASGTTAAASYLVLSTTNTASTTTTLRSSVNGSVLSVQNTNSTGGTSARGLSITVPSGRAPIVVNSAAGKATNLNADKLDGRDSTAFGQVVSFAQNTAYNEDYVTLASLGGLTLTRNTSVFDGIVHCHLYVSSSVAGRVDGFVVGGTTIAGGLDTPATNQPFGNAFANDSQTAGQIVFVNLSTARAVTVQFAIYDLPGNGGCRWTGTMTASI